MIKYTFSILLILKIILIRIIFSETITLSTLDFDTLNNAITNANESDIIILPQGEVTWTSPLVITKGITLKGAGMDKTILKCDFSDQNAGVVKFRPTENVFFSSYCSYFKW